MTQVVVGVDGSRAARTAFHEAVREAAWRDADVLAVHVVVVPVVAGRDISRGDIERLQQYGQTVIDHEMGVLTGAYPDGLPVAVETRVVVGHPGVEIMRAAGVDDDDTPTAELVVLGSRGLGGFKGLLLGSVSTYASHHLGTRLLIVPPGLDIDPGDSEDAG